MQEGKRDISKQHKVLHHISSKVPFLREEGDLHWWCNMILSERPSSWMLYLLSLNSVNNLLSGSLCPLFKLPVPLLSLSHPQTSIKLNAC